ncbi:lpg2148 family Dot/Icm T4SS effector [Legionella pneumophila serogroup 1]
MIIRGINMTKIKLESPGFMVHKKLKSMSQSYGVMMTGVPAEVLGQMQAERSIPSINKTGNLKQQIAKEVSKVCHMMTEHTQSCGQASNDVCELLLGKIEAEKFHFTKYEALSADGDNLKNVLENTAPSSTNLLIRFEIDREDPPIVLVKTKNENFNPETAVRNKIYLLENKLYFLDKIGNLFNLGPGKKKCTQLFNAIGDSAEYSLCDPFVLEEPEKPEDFAISEIVDIFNEQKERFDFWIGSHSFTIYIPQTLGESPRQFYPYQAYFGSHTLQDWFVSDKDEYLSRIGIDKYIEKLAVLGKTTNTKERSDIYAEFFSKRGREAFFCAHLNEKRQPLRVKFKITEINPELALKNLQETQEFIDTHPGENPSDKVENYRNRAKLAMTEHLESLLDIKPESSPSLFWKNVDKKEQEMTDSSRYKKGPS